MKKSILLVLVAALALAVGFSATAGAGVDGGAQAAAKKAAKCKAKKGKGKAGKSAATAQAKKKGKGCKGKKGKGSASGDWPPADGLYEDPSQGVHLTIGSNGKTAQLGFEASGRTCAPFIYSGETVPLSASAKGLRASESGTIIVAGIPVVASWTISIEKPTLAYTLEFNVKVDEINCDDKKVFKGTLS